MRFLLFDENAVSTYVSDHSLQSVEYQNGSRFVEHLLGRNTSEIFQNTIIEYNKYGILFIGRKKASQSAEADKHIFCIDLEACKLFDTETSPARLLTVIQRAFRLVLKIWNRFPFTSSERINGTKSILFPFSIADHHRLVIERSNRIARLEKRGISFPLLAYKYNAEDPGQNSDIVNIENLKTAGELYAENKYTLICKLEDSFSTESSTESSPINYVDCDMPVERSDFVFWEYERQLKELTESQRKIVESTTVDSPMRIDGAAGTGKTVSLILRAYRLLRLYRDRGTPFRIIFFAHNESTSRRNKDVFSFYPDSSYYLSTSAEQSIQFTTLFDFCADFSKIEKSSLIESDAENAKTYQMLLIDEVVKRAIDTNRIKTYKPIISEDVYDLFDPKKTDVNTLVNMLQHEFSIQIKGRTDGLIENYIELQPIPNGIPCHTKPEKELIFSLFTDYQHMLQIQETFDVDDVTIEAISRLNGPFWRRNRLSEGYDYIIVDEMHLFNFNEQSIFHFLSKDISSKKIPICFAIDYSQAIGDRGNVQQDYIANGAFGDMRKYSLCTLFRNSPQIVDFCASIAASGTLMFGATFANPYKDIQYHFTHAEELKMQIPKLFMYNNDSTMIDDLGNRLDELMHDLQCKQSDIAVITFDNQWLSRDGISMLQTVTKKEFMFLDRLNDTASNCFVLASPYAINGLEFEAVVLLGVDDGRVPQTAGTSDVSQNYLMYSAYNMLYLSASRAKYRVTIMGTYTRGVSACLEHSISNEVIELNKVIS